MSLHKYCKFWPGTVRILLLHTPWKFGYACHLGKELLYKTSRLPRLKGQQRKGGGGGEPAWEGGKTVNHGLDLPSL